MSDFPSKLVTYYEVWESDFSKFVSEFYNKPYSLQQREMLGQDTHQKVEVDGNNNPWEEGEEQLAKWLNAPWPGGYKYDFEFTRGHGPSSEVILWDLARKGIIPTGMYLIVVWW